MSFKYTPAALKKIEHILDEGAYVVRYEKGTFASGFCLLEHRKVVVINKFLSTEGKINALLEIIPGLNIDYQTLSGETKTLLEQLNIRLKSQDTIVENELASGINPSPQS